ncbi:MAG: toll/interleukin-1 receptor domain-containing protein [Planctomycetes bacterium]|nr:toll/interleukin-1 receptor domain-containing protein [Planctomycetota bacterium]
MDRKEALRLLKGGKEGIAEWNRRCEKGEGIPVLDGIALDGADLWGADLGGVHLNGATLSGAELCLADLSEVHLNGADLSDANLVIANLRYANLIEANLSKADLSGANLSDANVSAASLAQTVFGWTIVGNVDLSSVTGLETIWHMVPSTIGVDTLFRSQGKIPDEFLRGCGFQPWEISAAKLYDPSLTGEPLDDIVHRIHTERQRAIILGSVFISYSHTDAKFAEKLRKRLMKEGVTAWLDRHDMVAGPLQRQVERAIRLNDVVLTVLSKDSVESDWVEKELQDARDKEKKQGRDVLCPVALDNAWQGKMGDVLWRQAFKNNVLDFSKWKTIAFDRQFQKLLTGLKTFYGPASRAQPNDS